MQQLPIQFLQVAEIIKNNIFCKAYFITLLYINAQLIVVLMGGCIWSGREPSRHCNVRLLTEHLFHAFSLSLSAS